VNLIKETMCPWKPWLKVVKLLEWTHRTNRKKKSDTGSLCLSLYTMSDNRRLGRKIQELCSRQKRDNLSCLHL